jgi:archaellum component FlaC
MDSRQDPFMPTLGGLGHPPEASPSAVPTPTLERMLRTIYQKVVELETRQAQLRTDVLTRLGELEDRFEAFEPSSLEDLESKLDDVQSSLETVESRLEAMESTLSDVESTVSGIDSTVDRIDSTVSGIESTVDAL